LRNTITANSNQLVLKKFGIVSEFKTALYNNNIYNDNVTDLKDNDNIDNYLTIANDFNLPFGKFKKNSYQILKPRIFIKYTTGKMIDGSTSEKILNYSDVYSMNRTNSFDNLETGASIGYGLNYDISKKNKENNFKTSLGIGQVVRDKIESKMPSQSSLNNKSSDYAGFLKFNFIENKKTKEINKDFTTFKINRFDDNQFALNYEYNIDNDLSKINRNKFNLNFTYNRFNTSLEFDEKTHHIGNERLAKISFSKVLNDNYFLTIEGKKDLKNDRSEFNKISLNYENDCIVTSLSLAKDFYQDKDINNSKTLIFGILIKPFSDSFGPDLSEFIK
jgi:lipopolysaccharide assembly outer membrane protein LptD (OstA)